MRTLITIFIFCFYFIFSVKEITAQADTGTTSQAQLELIGYVDTYYVYDFNQPKSKYRQPFLYNYNRHNEFNLNLGFIKLAAQHRKYRANIALQTGTYASDNYANEPGILKNIFEANAGISLSKKNNLWLDAGVFPSHLGFESPISHDNWTLTRSLFAENSPYYLSGSKLSYTPTKKIELVLLVCNGWQHIQKIQGNSMPSFGTQTRVLPTEKITLNWSTFIGTDDPDSTRRMRYFNDFFGQFQLTKRFGLMLGFDLGTQQRAKNSSVYDVWLSPVAIGQVALNKNWRTAVRAEYYEDKTGIIIQKTSRNGFKTSGLSFTLDYLPSRTVVCRLEARWLKSQDKIFETKTQPSQYNFFIGTSLAIQFSELIHH